MREIDFVAEGAGTASYWKAIGVDVEITKSEAATHGARLREYVYGEMISWISGMDYLDPLTTPTYGVLTLPSSTRSRNSRPT